jgi:hypothetical protein
MTTYEICGYQYGQDADGDRAPLSILDGAGVTKIGWCLYVREYQNPGDGTWEESYDRDFDTFEDGTWEEIYDRDFDTFEEYQRAKEELMAKYPGAYVDEY